jgi:WD40 repeat protein
VWDLASQRRLFQYDLDSAAVALALGTPKAPGGSPMLAVATEDKHVRIYDQERASVRETLGPFRNDGRNEARPLRLAFSPDGNRLAIALDNGTVELYAFDGAKWKPIYTLSASAPNGLSFSASGESLLTAGTRDVVIWGKPGN